jgi:hypothetical protein
MNVPAGFGPPPKHGQSGGVALPLSQEQPAWLEPLWISTENGLRSGSGRPWKPCRKIRGRSIYGSSANRAEAKAIYNLPGNDTFNKNKLLRAHRAATIRGMEGHPLILAVQDTTSVNYDSRQKREGNGYIGDKTMGVNIHSCLAVTPEGLVLGVLNQMGFNRGGRKNTALTREQQ